MTWPQRLVLLSLLALAIFPALWLSRGLETPLGAEDFLPGDTVFFIHWNDFTRFADGVAGNPLARQLARKDFPEILRELGLEQAVVNRFAERLTLIRSFFELSFIPRMLESRGMLALLPNRTPSLDLLEGIGANLVFILPDRAGGRTLALAEREPWGVYQGTEIFRLRVGGDRNLYACRTHRLALYAFAPEPIRRCIDQALLRRVGGGVALADLPWPVGHRLSPERPGEFFAYVDIRALEAQPRWGEVLTPLWPGVRPRQATLAHSLDGRVSGLNAALRFDEDELNIWLAGHGLAAPARPQPAASGDAATLLHLWSNWFTPEVMAGLARAINATQLGHAVLAGMGAFLGEMSLETNGFHNSFAPELGLVVRSERAAVGQMKPLFALYFKPLDPVLMRIRLKRLVRPFPVRAHRLAHGAEAATIGMADGMVQPAFAFVGEHLVLADNLHMAQRMENQLHAGGERLPGAAGQPDEPVSASLFLFLRARQVAEAGETLLRYLVDAKNERGAALLDARQRLFAQEVALPFSAALQEAESGRLSLAVADGEARFAWECRLGKRPRRPSRAETKKAALAPAAPALDKTKKKSAR